MDPKISVSIFAGCSCTERIFPDPAQYTRGYGDIVTLAPALWCRAGYIWVLMKLLGLQTDPEILAKDHVIMPNIRIPNISNKTFSI
jgi:hypothetical protein